MFVPPRKRITGSTDGKPFESVKRKPTTSQKWNDWIRRVTDFPSNPEKSVIIPDVRPFVNILIFGKYFKALIDTGAMLTCISSEVAKYLDTKNTPTKNTTLKIHLANNQEVGVRNTYAFPCTLHNKETVIEAIHVTKLSTPIILGMDNISKLYLITMNFASYSNRESVVDTKPQLSAIKPLTQDEEHIPKQFLDEELPPLAESSR
ncbi:hypothetical protein J6590_018167 [Homalodisca vitripennis]|nr:hypothetical protein J6590_018167 [Homalodisca vitripennis]